MLKDRRGGPRVRLRLRRLSGRRAAYVLRASRLWVRAPAACHALAASDALATPHVRLHLRLRISDGRHRRRVSLPILWRCVRARHGSITTLRTVRPRRLPTRRGLAVAARAAERTTRHVGHLSIAPAQPAHPTPPAPALLAVARARARHWAVAGLEPTHGRHPPAAGLPAPPRASARQVQDLPPPGPHTAGGPRALLRLRRDPRRRRPPRPRPAVRPGRPPLTRGRRRPTGAGRGVPKRPGKGITERAASAPDPRSPCRASGGWRDKPRARRTATLGNRLGPVAERVGQACGRAGCSRLPTFGRTLCRSASAEGRRGAP
jgi:hypothetical protein